METIKISYYPEKEIYIRISLSSTTKKQGNFTGRPLPRRIVLEKTYNSSLGPTLTINLMQSDWRGLRRRSRRLNKNIDSYH